MEFIDIKTLLSLRTMFDLDNYAADFRSEIIAGVSIFLASLYIVMAQPAILSETGMPFTAVITATVLATAVSSILMGIYANNPVIVAPAMSVNSMFVYVSVTFTGITWEIALGVLFWSGIIFYYSLFWTKTNISSKRYHGHSGPVLQEVLVFLLPLLD